MDADAQGVYLIGGQCSACGFITLGVRRICPSCWATGIMAVTPIGRHAGLYSFTTIHQLPQGYDEPFTVGYLDLADGVRVFAHVENAPESLVIGKKLWLTSAALRKDDDGGLLTGPLYRSQNPE